MEVKEWKEEEFPDLTEQVEGAVELQAEEGTGVLYLHDIEYAIKDGCRLNLQILLPVRRDCPETVWPCLVYIQGSAWRQQDCYATVPSIAKLAERGVMVACVEYRHSGIAPFPAQAEDAADAVHFLRRNCGEYHIDPDRIFLGGASSGGHTAWMAALLMETGVKGIIDLFGAVSLTEEDDFPTTLDHHTAGSPEGAMMGGRDLRYDLVRRAAGSVVTYIKNDTEVPPSLLIHGTRDMVVNVQQSIRLYRHLQKNGKETALILVRGAGHGGASYWSDELTKAMDTFIGEHS